MFKHATKFLAPFARNLLILVSLFFTTVAMAGVELVMVEEDGCIWCDRWDSEIGPIYPKTSAGKAAPLRRIDIRMPLPDDIEVARPLRFTPTFVLLVDGIEQSRIEGYPGEDFFWGLFERMLDQSGVVFEDPS
ncbi:MAG: hypothetical protein L3J13_03380 [Devosiaceae bacterium]|nr:hypothetical protein [Devosiaceae bacterium]